MRESRHWGGIVGMLGLVLLFAVAGSGRAGAASYGPQKPAQGRPASGPATAAADSSMVDSGPPGPVLPGAGSKAVIIDLHGEIDDFSRDRLFLHFKQARDQGAKVVILDIDTWGGLVTSGLEISQFLKRQDDLHVIVYVQDKAISAGAMISMACDEIVMSDSSKVGDCAPIVFDTSGQLDPLPPAERAKQEGPIRADFDESARRNHHDPLLAAAMVSVEIVVHWVQSPDGKTRRFVDEDEFKTLTDQGWTVVPGAKDPIDSATTLLTVDSHEAVQYGLAMGIESSAQSLAAARGYDVIAEYTQSAGEKAIELLSSAGARSLMLITFLVCAYVVLHAPGHGVAEVVGLLALGCMLGVPMMTGYAQWWEIILVFVGLLLVAVEVLLPGHILPGVTGAILAFAGLVLTFVPMEPGSLPGVLPHMHSTWAALQGGLLVVTGSLAGSVLIWIWLNRFLPSLPVFNRLILTETSGGRGPEAKAAAVATAASQPEPVSWPLIGSVGRTMSELKPGGSAEFFDDSIAGARVVSVISDSGFVPPGSSVVVREVAGSRVVVHPA